MNITIHLNPVVRRFVKAAATRKGFDDITQYCQTAVATASRSDITAKEARELSQLAEAEVRNAEWVEQNKKPIEQASQRELLEIAGVKAKNSAPLIQPQPPGDSAL
jgi:hypothetical protein